MICGMTLISLAETTLLNDVDMAFCMICRSESDFP